MPMLDPITDPDEAEITDEGRYRVRVRHALFRWHDEDGSLRHTRRGEPVDLPRGEFDRAVRLGAVAAPTPAAHVPEHVAEFTAAELREVIEENDVDGVLDFAREHPASAEDIARAERAVKRTKARKGVLAGLAAVIRDRDADTGDTPDGDETDTGAVDTNACEVEGCDYVAEDEDDLLDHYNTEHPDEDLPGEDE